jgi:L-fucose isomerase-like protein
MDMTKKKITFGVIVSNRGFFNAQLAFDSGKELFRVLDLLGYAYVAPEPEGAFRGIVSTLSDAKVCAHVLKEHADEIDGIIVILPNFGDEQSVVESISRSGLRVPVLVQASNDEINKVDVKSRRDAFCGKISVCNNLYQYNIPFTDTTGHTTDISGTDFKVDIIRFAAICRVVTGLRHARVGLVGTRPTAFQTVRFSEKLLQQTGITTVPVDLTDIHGIDSKLSDTDSDVVAKIEAIKLYGKIPASIKNDKIMKQAKFSVAVDKWCEANEIDASAIQCWNSLEDNYGCAACVTMSMLSEQKKPCACEADVAGAISMYALTLAGDKPAALLDWNNNYGHEKDLCVNTHCSNFPRSFMGTDIEISNLDLLGETFGPENCFGAVKGHVQPGDMTFLRISTDDTKGLIKAYVGEGEFVARPFPMDGGIAVCKVADLRKLLRIICSNGFEHHVAMVRSHVAGIVYEAVTKYLGWETYYHNAPEDAEEIVL